LKSNATDKLTTDKQPMANKLDNLKKGDGFDAHPDRINRNGRPKKYVTLLKEQGYKLAEINDTIQAMLSMDLDELKEVWQNPKATVLEKTIANAMRKSLEKGSLYSIETLLSRVYGKPKETADVNQTVSGEIKITLNLDGQ
jgi:tRNA A37 N6-isopentenylltransferase MiaA